MVDVLPLPANQEEPLLAILKDYFAETGSDVAHGLIESWASEKSRISLVMPRDYARVLEVIERAEREGVSADTAIMEALNG